MVDVRVRAVTMVGLLGALVSSAMAETTTLAASDAYRLDYDSKSGRLALRTPKGADVMTGLSTSVALRRGQQTLRFEMPPPSETPGLTWEPFTDALGKGQVVGLPAWSDSDKSFRVEASVKLYEGQPFFAIATRLEAIGKEGIELVRLTPLETTAGLGLDTDPRHIWIIENGNGLLLDFYVRRLRASGPANSNGNILLYAPRRDLGLVLGFLNHAVARTGFRTEVTSTDPPRISRVTARCDYDPPKPIAPGGHIDSEGGVYVALTHGQPLEAAERWASCVAKTAGHGPLTRGRLVKWNSWAARYAQKIDEPAMCAEMNAAAAKLLPYGMETFHVDAGWERAWGHWEPRETFPGGMKALADRARKLGFRPSIWMAPFAADKGSPLARQHQPWLLRKGLLARGIMGDRQVALDVTRPGVKAWLEELFRRSADGWGYDCFKLDFLYYASACAPFGDTSKTTQEAYREVLGVIRECIGNGRILYPVGVPIISNVGYADVIRLGLDNKPVWNKARGPHDQGIRTSVRTLSRRYYLNHRIWINHPDVLFTGDPRTAKRWRTDEVLTLDEARAWSTLVGLASGVICLGDSIVDLTGPRLDMIRRIIPPIGESARPLDLFEHRFAEQWNLPIRRDFETWNVVGLFHWGDNDRWGTPMPDARRTRQVQFAELGLDPQREYAVYEFWQDRFLGLKRGGFEVSLQPHSCQVFAIRAAQKTPQLLSTNRHVSQGGAEIRSTRWHPKQGAFSCTQRLVGGWRYAIALRIPKGFTPTGPVGFEPAATSGSIESELKHESGEIWRLRFSAPQTQEEITWTVRVRRGAS